ncbi:MAG: fused MFS/spermidine synthase [Hyphomonadaceae bacterium]|nr:fused MFS/spermidine synthase [Hyphomonadaceae bacterium]
MNAENASPSPAPPSAGAALARRSAAPVFALALFLSAALIFVLQPLFGRMVTPLLGGSPQVWNVSMAFFQGALLVGYVYAHLLARIKDLRVQAAIHALVLVGAWFALPIHVSAALGPPSSEHPALWLVGVLALSVGAPFAAASATAPLLQHWYARTGRSDAHDPYYLYAASNLGSFVGLLAYPAVVEPLLGAHAQSNAWSGGYAIVGAFIVGAALLALQAKGEAPSATRHVDADPTWRERLYWIGAAAVPSAMSLGVTLHISTDVASAPMLWVIPLALYLATFVIAFMKNSEALAPATLLVHPIAVALMVASYFASGNWVMSVSLILAGFFFSALVCHLALAHARPGADRLTEFYLFVSLGGVLGGAFAAFLAPVIFNNVYEFPLALAAACLFRPRAASDMPRLADASVAAAVAVGVLGLLSLRLAAVDSIIVLGALGAAAAMVAAGWSGEERPAPMRYAFLAIAVAHAGLVIWIAFNMDSAFASSVAEGRPQLALRQPWSLLLMVTSFMVLAFGVHGTIQPRRDNRAIGDYALGAAMPSAALLIALALAGERMDDAETLTVVALLVCALAVFINRGRPAVLASIVLIAFASIFVDDLRGSRIITQERSFFGVLRTRVMEDPNDPEVPPLRILMHGTTIHGAQLAAPGLTRQPLTYYHPNTALGEAILAGLSTAEGDAHMALIGLGAGSSACLTRPTDRLTIFEIDPAVVRLSAEPGGDFTYVPECQPNARIELGDARLQIAEEPSRSYDVIVVDAFSSDAIPAHLLTREALALYLSKVTDNGIVVLHLSNRNLALVSEAARVAHAVNAPTLYRVSDRFEQPYVSYYGGLAASVMIVARAPQALTSLQLASADWRVIAAPSGRAWSDDYINVPRALWENLTGQEQCRLFPYLPRCGGDEAATDEPPTGEGAAPSP